MAEGNTRQISRLGALLCAALACAPEDAQACSPLGVPSIVLGSTLVPSDGLIAGVLSECDGCLLEDLYVERVDGDGGRVPGRLVAVRPELAAQNWIAFQPDQPLPPGGRYIVHVPHESNPYATDPAAFEAVAPAPEDPSASGYYRAVRNGLDRVACADYDPDAVGGSCTAPVFYKRSVLQATLQVTPTGANASQRAYRVVWTADGKIAGGDRAQLGQPLSHTFSGKPASVCFELYALPLVQGDEQRIGGECFSTVNDELGETPGTFGEQAETLRSCLTPPEGYEEAWCKAVLARGWEGSGTVERAREACDPPGDPDAAQNPTGDATRNPGEASSGCRVHQSRGGMPPGILCGLLAVLLGRVRRRTRSRVRMPAA